MQIHLGEALRVDEGAHAGGRVEAVSAHDVRGGLGQHGGELVVHALLHQDAVGGDAGLARVAELGGE